MQLRQTYIKREEEIMQINKLWTLPVLSSEIEEGININNEGMDMILSFYINHENEIKRNFEIRFKSVLCHMHTSERFTKKLYDSYDTLVCLEGSEWLNNLKILNPRDFDYWNPKHFVIYFDSVGQYQFIASDFLVCEIKL